MNLAAIASAALRRAPHAVVTLRNKDGDETTGTATGVPASGGDAESFEVRAVIRTKAESFVLLPDGLAFAPAIGMIIERGTEKWTILGVSTLNPTGDQVILYRIVAQR